MFSSFSNYDFSVLMGMQFLAQVGQGIVQGAIGKSIAFGGQKGFDVSNVPSADYLLKVVLYLYVPYTLLSPFIGVFIDRFPRRRVVWWTNIITGVVVAAVAVTVMIPLGKHTSEGNVTATVALILGLLAAQACVRVALAVKSAAIPDVLSGKDLLRRTVCRRPAARCSRSSASASRSARPRCCRPGPWWSSAAPSSSWRRSWPGR